MTSSIGGNIKILNKIIVILWVLSLSIGCKASNLELDNKNQIEAEVNKAFEGLVEAAKSLDSSRYFEFFDRENFTGLNADGKVWHSIKSLESIILPGFQMVEKTISLDFRNVKITVINQTTAILVNEYDQTILLKSGEIIKQSGGGTQVWHQIDSTWKLVSVSSSSAHSGT